MSTNLSNAGNMSMAAARMVRLALLLRNMFSTWNLSCILSASTTRIDKFVATEVEASLDNNSANSHRVFKKRVIF